MDNQQPGSESSGPPGWSAHDPPAPPSPRRRGPSISAAWLLVPVAAVAFVVATVSWTGLRAGPAPAITGRSTALPQIRAVLAAYEHDVETGQAAAACALMTAAARRARVHDARLAGRGTTCVAATTEDGVRMRATLAVGVPQDRRPIRELLDPAQLVIGVDRSATRAFARPYGTEVDLARVGRDWRISREGSEGRAGASIPIGPSGVHRLDPAGVSFSAAADAVCGSFGRSPTGISYGQPDLGSHARALRALHTRLSRLEAPRDEQFQFDSYMSSLASMADNMAAAGALLTRRAHADAAPRLAAMEDDEAAVQADAIELDISACA
jgi:hypothetical protein